jgi:hypothetical protein
VALGNSVVKRMEENTNITKMIGWRSDRTVQWPSDQQRLVIIMQRHNKAYGPKQVSSHGGGEGGKTY